jgi:hypothetical protein
MSGLTNNREDLIMDRLFRDDPGTIRPNGIYIAALKTLPTNEAMAGIQELGMGGYDRVNVGLGDANWSDPTAGTQGEVDNVAEIDFGTLTGTTERVVGIAIMDSLSGTTASDYIFYSSLATGWKEFTAADSGDQFRCVGHGFSNDDRVFLRGLNLPTGAVEQTEYFVANSAADTFTLSTTVSDGSPLVITSDGGGQVGASQAQDISNGNQLKIAIGALNIRLN